MAEKDRETTDYEKWFAKLRRWERRLYRPFFPYKKYGHTEQYDGTYIFVGNHRSLFDVVFIVVGSKRPVHFIAKKEVLNKKTLRKFALKSQCIYVSRDGTDIKAVMEAMRYLKNGESVGIFPEGTRNKTKEPFLPFKSGATTLSIKTRTPIIPVVQVNKIRFLRRSKVIYGEPIEFTEYYGKKITEKEIEECDEILRSKMFELYEELKNLTSEK